MVTFTILYYNYIKMKNTILSVVKYAYYLSIIILIILYLFPGSLIGYFLYGSLGLQPQIISNPFGTSINHLIFFSFITILAKIISHRFKNFYADVRFILFLSIFLELSHLLIPNRAFEFYDLFGNILGVLLIIFLFKFFKW